ncbi:hypothetical protein ACFO5R_03080 [Halosolutus amylolyticus]|uniref:Uncharacterized protein n=1 Tax=Halosolutus amylolyticus TaxID=2932267 RepID=A0ABD5PKC6_9EURY|nr:hypothetical protein [Halosolutus amylolyticus]
MPTDQHPIPREALPPGWGPAELRDGYVSYRHSTLPLELIADCTRPDRSHPSLGLGRCWELKHRYALADRSITETIGRVSTRRAAVNGLLECMNRIHEVVDEPADRIEIQDVLHRVSLADVVPDCSPSQ